MKGHASLQTAIRHTGAASRRSACPRPRCRDESRGRAEPGRRARATRSGWSFTRLRLATWMRRAVDRGVRGSGSRAGQRAMSTPSGMRCAVTPRSRSASIMGALAALTAAARRKHQRFAAAAGPGCGGRRSGCPAIARVRRPQRAPRMAGAAMRRRRRPRSRRSRKTATAPGRKAVADVPRPTGSARAPRRRPHDEKSGRRCGWWHPRVARCRAATPGATRTRALRGAVRAVR